MKAFLLVALAGHCLSMRPVEEGLAPLFQDTPEDVPHDQCGVSAMLNEDESVELFALGLDNNIYHQRQNPDHSWSSWSAIGLGNNVSFATNGQAVRGMDGRLEIFAIGTDDQLYHNWQQTPGGSYQSQWIPLGGPFSGSPSVLLNSEGNLVVFCRGKISRSLMYNHQVHNATAVFWAGWSNLGGILTSGPNSILTAEAMVHVFVRGVDKGLFEKKQVATHSGTVAWSKFESLGGLLASHPSVPAALNPVNLMEVFVRQADRAIWFKKQVATTYDTDSVAWSEWQSLGGKFSSGPSVIVNDRGFLEVFSRGMDGQIFTKSQIEHDGSQYTPWASLGGESASTPTALIHPDGSVYLFYRGADKKIYVANRRQPDDTLWSTWYSLQNSNGFNSQFQLFYC